jgi:S-formylglutathione hydrolase FrmB
VPAPRRRVAALAAVLLAAALAATLLELARAGGAEWPPARTLHFHSNALRDDLGISVYLPPGYATSQRRYPVLYFLHGLPASSSAYRGLDFLRRALARSGRQGILVTVQGARESEEDGEYLDSGPGHDWETAIAVELPRFVDAHFRTVHGRRGRGIVGLSAGGYGAMLIGLHHLERFAAIESWSGYFRPTNPSGTDVIDLGSTQANRHASAHSFVGTLRAAFRRHPTFVGFYVGTRDGRFRAENEMLDRELDANGVPHRFRLYDGAHARGLWESKAPEWLRLAYDNLAKAG